MNKTEFYTDPLLSKLNFIPLETPPETNFQSENVIEKYIGITFLALGIIAVFGTPLFAAALIEVPSFEAVLGGALSYVLIGAGCICGGAALVAHASPSVNRAKDIDDHTRFDYAYALLGGSLKNLVEIYDREKMVANGMLSESEADEVENLVQRYKQVQLIRKQIEGNYKPDYEHVKGRVKGADSFENYLETYYLSVAYLYQIKIDPLEESWYKLQGALKLRKENGEFIGSLIGGAGVVSI